MIPIFFILGFWKGRSLITFVYKVQTPSEIHALFFEGTIPIDLINAFQNSTNYVVKYVFIKSDEDPLKYLLNNKFDIISLGPKSLKKSLNQNSLLPLPHSLIQMGQNISQDFCVFDADRTFALPIQWKITDEPKRLLWIHFLAIPKEVPNSEGAIALYRFLLHTETMYYLTIKTNLPTTNLELNNEQIRSDLKASAIRQLSFAYLELAN